MRRHEVECRGGKSRYMEEDISKNLQILEQRMQELKGSASDDTLSEAMEELSISIEEMHAAEAELIEANKRLEEERWRYKELFDFAPDAYLVTNLYGIIKEANRAASALLKVSHDLMIGKPLQVFLHKSCLNTFRTNVGYLRQGKDIQGFEAWVIPRKDKPMPVAISVNPIGKPDGSLTGLRWMLHDMAETKRKEAELRSAKEAAEEAAKVKAQFMANMSHELRTPLNAIIGMTSLLLGDRLTAEQRENVEILKSSGCALLNTINDILDFSRLERERVELDAQAFDLRTTVEESLDSVAVQASNKGLELIYDFEKDTPEHIIGDSAKLRQVLINLLGNAVTFTGEGEVMLFVMPGEQPDEIHFAIKDTGIGIPREQMNKLFLPFSQVDMSLSRAYEGTGLGLAISRKLVELMGGRIWAESVEGEGSTFHLTIKAPEAVASGKPQAESGAQDESSGKRALIVEGNADLRGVLKRQLFDWGMITTSVSSAKEAKDLLTLADSFDLVILDANVPDAVSLAEEIGMRLCQPLIMLVSVGTHFHSEICSATVTKPLKPARLREALRDLTAMRDADSQETKAPTSGKSPSCKALRILLVEDSLSSQKVMLGMLRRLGYRTDVASNGLEALAAMERQPYDVVLMDVKMPEMDGLEATRQIRRRWSAEKQPKIIAITAYALNDSREWCLQSGMDDYIAKPVQIEDLRAVIDRACTRDL